MKRSQNDPKRNAAAGSSGTPSDKSNVEPESGFLGRWSQRKQSSTEQLQTSVKEAQSPLLDEELPVEVIDTALDEEAKAEGTPILTDEDMPDVESLNADSDYSPFLSEGVSKELRNLALKKLFFSGKFGIRDGLDDYDDDFTYFEPLGDTVTSDMKFHARRKERARQEELAREEMALREEAAEELEEESQESTDELTSEESKELQGEDMEALENDKMQSDDIPDEQSDTEITLAEQDETQNPTA